MNEQTALPTRDQLDAALAALESMGLTAAQVYGWAFLKQVADEAAEHNEELADDENADEDDRMTAADMLQMHVEERDCRSEIAMGVIDEAYALLDAL